jgi:hypothetical protein
MVVSSQNHLARFFKEMLQSVATKEPIGNCQPVTVLQTGAN